MEKITKRYLEQLDASLAYSVAEAAELVGINERRMWDQVREGLIKSFRDGHRRLISRRAIEDYVAAREAETAAPSAAPEAVPPTSNAGRWSSPVDQVPVPVWPAPEAREDQQPGRQQPPPPEPVGEYLRRDPPPWPGPSPQDATLVLPRPRNGLAVRPRRPDR
jgi:excisionase family DNA binding protein